MSLHSGDGTLVTASEQELANTIYNGDCLYVLKGFPGNFVGLVYADPPFFTERSFFLGRTAVFSDRWAGGLAEYLNVMYDHFVELRRVMRKDATIYVHCDFHASHYIKVILDRVFGYGRFLNEVVWKRQSAHCDAKQGARNFGRIHDVLLVYTKSEDYVWNQRFVQYAPGYIRKYYRYTEEETGRRFALGDLTAPGGFGNGNPKYGFKGVKRYWRYSESRMDALLKEGRIYISGQGRTPRIKRYLDEMPGIPLQDIWDDVTSFKHGEKQRYPTQKPLGLLERILAVSSDCHTLVLDPYCGSGTTLLAAQLAGRTWIGIDKSKRAVQHSSRRLARAGANPKIRIANGAA